MTIIVTGDDVALPVTLKKDGKTFSIANNAVVKAALVSADHNDLLAGPVILSNSAAGSNWGASLVIVQFNAQTTGAITSYKPSLLEIEVNDNGKLTWFADVRIIKGNIN